jgi:hypothetical protein
MNRGRLEKERYDAWVRELSRALGLVPAARIASSTASEKVSVYPAGSELPFQINAPRKQKFSESYANGKAWIAAVGARAPEAIELAIDVSSRLDPERGAALAIGGASLDLWPAARERIARALAQSTGEQAFSALLEMLRETSAAGASLRSSRFSDGCALALRKLEGSQALRYTSVALPTSAEWDRLSPKRQEREREKLEELDDADPYDVREAEALILYLGEKGCKKARSIVERLYAEHPSENVRIAAGHALIDFGDARSFAHLLSFRDSSDDWRQWFATKAEIAKNPKSALDRLGGQEALESDGFEKLALRALDVLDTEGALALELGRTPWIAADARWLDVAAYWTQRGREAASYVMKFFAPAQQGRARQRARRAQTKKPVAKVSARGRRVPPGKSAMPPRQRTLLDEGRRPTAGRETRPRNMATSCRCRSARLHRRCANSVAVLAHRYGSTNEPLVQIALLVQHRPDVGRSERHPRGHVAIATAESLAAVATAHAERRHRVLPLVGILRDRKTEGIRPSELGETHLSEGGLVPRARFTPSPKRACTRGAGMLPFVGGEQPEAVARELANERTVVEVSGRPRDRLRHDLDEQGPEHRRPRGRHRQRQILIERRQPDRIHRCRPVCFFHLTEPWASRRVVPQCDRSAGNERERLTLRMLKEGDMSSDSTLRKSLDTLEVKSVDVHHACDVDALGFRE